MRQRVFVFSARSWPELRSQLAWLASAPKESSLMINAGRLARTLRARRAQRYRLAVVCSDIAELCRHMHAYLGGKGDLDHVFSGEAEPATRTLPRAWRRAHRQVLAALWVEGAFDTWPRARCVLQTAVHPTREPSLLARCWQEVLDLDQTPAPDDQFFALGGNSLAALRLVARLREAGEFRLSPGDIFRLPRFGDILASIENSEQTAPQRAATPLRAPLTAAQSRLHFLQRLEPNSRAYHVPLEISLGGSVALLALTQAIRTVCERHLPLRSRYPLSVDTPLQEVGELPAMAVLVDLGGLDPVRRDRGLRELAVAHALRPFDLAAQAPFRAVVLRETPSTHHLLCCLHHLACDGWSIGVFLDELRAHYAAQMGRAQPPPLPATDYFALAGRPRIDTGKLAWWQRQLAGLELPELPCDHKRPARPTTRGARFTHRLEPAWLNALTELAERTHTTLFSVLELALRVLLWRWSGQLDLALGTAYAGRAPQTERLIGLFIETLVLRQPLDPHANIAEALRVGSTALLKALDHAEVPFERLVQSCDYERDESRPPLVQVMLILQNVPYSQTPLIGSDRLELALTETGSCAFELAVEARVDEGALRLQWDYASDLLSCDTIKRQAQCFEMLLRTLPKIATLAELPNYTESERAFLETWQGEAVPVNRLTPLAERFLNTALMAANRPAVAHGLKPAHSYGDFAAAALWLAAELRRRGLRREDRVAVLLPRDTRLPLALLAVLMAGAAYVPLDELYPRERLAIMLEDAAPKLVICDSARAALVGTWPILPLEQFPATETCAAAELPMVLPEQLAYLLFTSGSTGRPKGVMIPQLALANLLHAMAQAPGLGPQDTLVAVTTPCFDIAALELFLPLLVGARLIVADRTCTGDPLALAALLDDVQATVLQATPATWTLLAESGWRRPLRMLCGGEALAPELARALLGRGGELWNVYGPTETTIWSTCLRVLEAPGAGDETPLALGRPIANTTCTLLDRDGLPVALGAVGELTIGGLGLARGYLGRPALTAERFIPDADATEPGARRYRTGDLARFQAESQAWRLLYLGRADFQVKLRGYRIEPGEIENALLALDGVAQAAVRPRRLPSGDLQLVAWLRARPRALLDSDALRTQLAGRLPEYMVPAVMVVLDAFPLTANGKIDRRALDGLPLPQVTVTTKARHLTEAEREVAEVFGQVLGQDDFGPDDHFFRRGGHSLDAGRAIAALSRRIGRDLPLRLLFDAPTVAALAAQLARDAAPGIAWAAPSVAPREESSASLSFAQERLWYLDRLQGPSSSYNLPVAFRFQGAVAAIALETALTALVERHPSLATRFPTTDPPCQELDRNARLSLRVVDLSSLRLDIAAAAAQVAIQAEADRPFDLTVAPLVRCLLLRAPDHHCLVFNHHHIISDAWSAALLMRDWGRAYEAMLAGRTPTWAVPASSSLAFARWQRAPQRLAALAPARAWWRAQLVETAALNLARALPPSPPASPSLVRLPLALDGVELTALRQRYPELTTHMLLLTAFALVLARSFDQERFVLAIASAGRDRPEWAELVGFLVHTLPLPLDLRGESATSFAQLADRVRALLLGALEHQELPLQLLAQDLREAGRRDGDDLWRVAFVLRNVPPVRFALASTELEPLPLSGSKPRFALALDLETDGQRCQGTLDYDPSQVSPLSAGRLVVRFQRMPALLLGLGAQPLALLGSFEDAAPPDLHAKSEAPLVPIRPTAQPPRPPRGPIELLVAEQLTQLLGLAEISATANFFELGMHSMLAARLAGRLVRACGKRVGPADLFAHPSVAELASWLALHAVAALPAIAPAPLALGEHFRLSPAQERIWFIHRLDSQEVVYNVALGNLLEGPLAAATLAKALENVRRRHESLNLSFPDIDGQPLACLADASCQLRVVDLRALADAEPVAQALGASEMRRPFDIARPPLLRALLVRVGQNRAYLWLCMHHLVVDGPSLVVILRHLAQAYHEALNDSPVERLPAPVQYRAYADWQRQLWQSGALAEPLERCRQRLTGAPRLDLVSDLPRPAVLSFSGAQLPVELPPVIYAALCRNAGEWGTTPFSTLLAVFAILLSRYSHQRDLVVGTVAADRRQPELAELVGLCLNLLPLRMQPKPELSFSAFAAQVQSDFLAAQRDAELPFQLLVDQLVPDHQPQLSPLFQVLFTLQSEAALSFDLVGCQATPLLCDTGTAKYDLSFSLLERGNALVGVVEYNRNLFLPDTIARLWRHFACVAEQAAHAPSLALRRFELLDAEERRRLVEALAASAAPPPPASSLIAWLAARAAEQPEATAVLAGEARLTRAGLMASIARLAACLRERGVGPEVPVAVLLERGLDLPIALLAVLAAGGCYIPMDPIYPSARLAQILEDGRPACVIAEPATFALLPPGAPPVIAPDARPRRALLPELVPMPERLAYILFTSGSTGRPKGVQIAERALLNFLAAMARQPGMAPGQTLLAVTTPCFDIAALELYLPLVCGGICAIADQDSVSDGFRLRLLVEHHRVDVLQATPATWTMLLEAGPIRPLTALCGGEALAPALAARLLGAGHRLWNLYGPTETTIWSAVAAIEAGSAPCVHLGQAIAHTSLQLLDGEGRPVPTGVPGELCIGGQGLARGYRGRAGLTADRFIPDPFSHLPGGRLYRTGDLARRDAAGQLHYLGRTDFQVKLRGYRIELGEIEKRLLTHEDVAEAVVVAREVHPDQPGLVAYVVARPGVLADNDPHLRARLRHELVRHLRESLPEYMLPTFTVFLERFPLTLNGKIDRRALPAPVVAAALADYEAPRGSAERVLAAVWGQLFQRPRISRNDRFHELGGDSLTVIRMVAMVAQHGLRLLPRDVLVEPCLQHLAALAQPLVGVTQRPETGPLPVSPHLHWFLEHFDPTRHVWLMSQAMDMRVRFAPQRFAEILQALMTTHQVLRLRLALDDARPSARIAPCDDLPFELHDLRPLPPAQRAERHLSLAMTGHRSLSILDGPVVRLQVFILADEAPLRVHLAVHHAICDFYSFYQILLDDLCTLVRQFEAGTEPRLAPVSCDYRTWCERLVAHLNSPELSLDKAWWLAPRRLRHLPLCRDFEERRHSVGDMQFLHQDLEPKLSRELVQLAGALGLGLEVLLLAALVEVLCGHDRDCLRLDVEHHGRDAIDDLDLSRTCGALTTKIPLVLASRGQRSVEAWLQELAAELQAPHAGLGHGILRYLVDDPEVAPLRACPGSDLFFNYRGRISASAPFAEFSPAEPVDCGRPDDPVSYLLIVNGHLAEDQLALSWLYSLRIHRASTIANWAEGLRAALCGLLEQVAARSATS